MNGKVIIGCDLDTRKFDKRIDYVESQMQEIEDKLKQADMGFEVGDTQKLEADYERLGIKLDNLRKKQAQLNQEQAQMGKLDLSGVQSGVNNVNKGLQNTIKKVAKWGLALFGIRSTYNAIRSAMSVISQYDTQMANNIEYIRYALASSLQPVIQTILNLVVKLLQYINYIAKAWTGKNLFKTADAFKDAQVNAKGLNKELQKTTAGFDEINTVSSQNTSGASGISTPNIDLTELPEGDVPKWVQAIVDFGNWVKDNWKTILGILLGIGAVIIIFKLFSKTSKEMVPSITEGANAFLKYAGLALVLASFALVLHEIANLITAFSESGLKLTDVIGLMATVLGTIIILMGSVALLGPAMTAGMIPFLAIVGGISTILLVMAATLPTILDAVGKFIQQTAPSLCMILTTIGNLIKDIILALGTTLPPIINSVGDVFQKVFDGISQVINTVGNVIISIMRETERLVNSVLSSLIWFINQLGPAINNFVDGAISATTKLVNFIVSAIEYLVNTLIVKGVNKIIKSINSISKYVGITIPTVSDLSISRFRPRLAKGGIINMPGRGVPIGYGQAIGGERGAEGVIPFTDSQQMALLGEAIGKYVRIDNVIDVNMDSRRINRILQSSSNRTAFASNR